MWDAETTLGAHFKKLQKLGSTILKSNAFYVVKILDELLEMNN